MKETGPQEMSGEYVARWERVFDKVLTPLEEFTHQQSSGSILLVIATLLALGLANSGLADWYAHLSHTPIGFSFGGLGVQKTLHHWVNDGLMAIFFFVVGLELKREFLVGELANPKNAALPIVAAIGGMVVPAVVYVLVNLDAGNMHGWGIPMATDIAFAVGVLVLLGDRIPKSLLTFLIALAIVDDLGAVLVIALFYTDTISLAYLAAGVVIFFGMLALKFGGIRHPLPYFIMALFLWFALLHSGVHATVAGILGAMTVPVRPKYDTARFVAYMKNLVSKFEETTVKNPDVLTNNDARALLQTLQNGVHEVQAPLQQLEHTWHYPVVYLVLPIFAFVNAGVAFPVSDIAGIFADNITLGVILGLVVGKPLGIAGFSVAAVMMGLGRLPKGVSYAQIVGVAFLGGIGFTMSIFVAELAFGGNAAQVANAKMGILIASLLAGVVGYFMLRISSKRAA